MSKDEDPERTIFRPIGAPPTASGWQQPSAWRDPAPSGQSNGWGRQPQPAWSARPAEPPPAMAVPNLEPVRSEPKLRWSGSMSPTALLLGGSLALAVSAAAAILLWPDDDGIAAAEVPQTETPLAVETAGATPAAASPQQAVLAAMPEIECSWLNLSGVQDEAGGLSLAVTGAAGHPVRAQNQIAAAAERAGARVAQLDFSAVAQVNPRLCGPVQAFSKIRDAGAQRLAMPAQTMWEIEPQQVASDEGMHYAQPLIEVNIGNASQDFALFGMEGSSGLLQPIVTSRAQFDGIESSAITRLPNDRFRLVMATGHTGWSGIMLVTGQGPFDAAAFVPDDGGADWARRFAAEARTRGWKTEMLWYKVVDALPNQP